MKGPSHHRVKLLGWKLRCHIRGRVKATGITDAPMSWPYTNRQRKDHRPSVMLCGDLVRAVRKESATAVAYWWGVSIVTVWWWRKNLGVEEFTEGAEIEFGPSPQRATGVSV